VDVTVTVRDGHPAPETLDAADELDADLLAIATHGRSGVERMLMGSVAEKVIRRAPCPVFTVKSFGQSLVRESENGAN
jgi:nucleotide-binding universal stress UspA family protein